MILLLPFSMMTDGSGDPIDHLDSSLFWKSRNIQMTTSALLQASHPPNIQNVEDLVAKLGAPNFAERKHAEKELLANGPGILPQMRRAMQSEDPEVSERAARIVKALAPLDHYSDVQRLMAIRGLGELGDREAIPALQAFLEDPDITTREYAQRAIARIEGKEPLGHKPDPKAMDRAIASMQQGNLLAAIRPSGRPLRSLNQLLKLQPMADDPDADFLDREFESIHQQIVDLLEATGPFRLDQVLLRAGNLPGSDPSHIHPWVVIVLTGRFDVQRIVHALDRLESKSRQGVDVLGHIGFPMPRRTNIHNAPVYVWGERGLFAPISPEHLVLVAFAKPQKGGGREIYGELKKSLSAESDAPVNFSTPLSVELHTLLGKYPMAGVFWRHPEKGQAGNTPFPIDLLRAYARSDGEGWAMRVAMHFLTGQVTEEFHKKIQTFFQGIREPLGDGMPNFRNAQALEQKTKISQNKEWLTLDLSGLDARVWHELPILLQLNETLHPVDKNMGGEDDEEWLEEEIGIPIPLQDAAP